MSLGSGAGGAFRRFQLFLRQVDVLVDAHDGLAALVGQLIALGGGSVHALLNGTGLEGLDDAAFLFNALEDVPDFPGGFVRQVFQVPGTAGGVHYLVQVAFPQQHQRAVAGDAAGEFVRHAHGRVKGQHINAVHAAHDGGEGLGGAAQKVDPRVHLRKGPEGGAGMKLDFGSFLTAAAFLHDDGPEFAQGADFGDFQEQVGSNGDRKAHVRGSFIHGDAAFLHGAQVGHSGREHGAHFFKGGSAGVRIRQSADADGLEGGSVGDGPFGHHRHLVIIGADALPPAEGALHHGLAHRVVQNAALEVRRVESGRLVRVQEHGESAQAAGAGRDVHGQLVKLHTLESGIPVGLLAQLQAALAVELDVHGSEAAVQIVQKLAVEIFRSGGGNALGNFAGLFHIAQGARSAAVRELPGRRHRSVFIPFVIDGMQSDSLHKLGKKLLVKVSPFQGSDGCLTPFGVCGWCEFSEVNLRSRCFVSLLHGEVNG